MPVRAPDGTLLLFETYQRRDAVEATGRRIWLPFAVLLLASLVLLWLVQVPLAWRLGRRLQGRQRSARRSSSTPSRRRPTSGAGSRPTSTTAPSRTSPASRTRSAPRPRRRRRPRRARRFATRRRRPATRCAASGRCSSRSTRPTCGRAGSNRRWATSWHGSSARVATELEIDDGRLTADDERLVYRAAAEALRNVERHAGADERRSRAPDGGRRHPARRPRRRCRLLGRGAERRRADGHVGLSLLEEFAARAGANVEVRSAPGAGTTFTLELPHR